jgi:hypothetical protein
MLRVNTLANFYFPWHKNICTMEHNSTTPNTNGSASYEVNGERKCPFMGGLMKKAPVEECPTGTGGPTS